MHQIPLNDYDVLFLCETFATAGFEIDNFTCIHTQARKLPRGRPMGGLTIAINKRLRQSGKTLMCSEHSLAVSLSDTSIKLIVTYFPPNTVMNIIFAEIEQVLDSFDDSDSAIYCGDFNCRTENNLPRGKDLMDFFYSKNFICLNDPETPTYVAHNGQSTIDLIFYRQNQHRSHATIDIVPSHITKHHLAVAYFDLNPDYNSPKQPRIKNVNLEALTEYMKLLEKPHDDNIDESYDGMVSAIQKSAICRSARVSKPWFDKELYSLNENLKQIYRKQPFDPINYTMSKKTYKKKIKFKKKQYFLNKEMEIITAAQTNRKQFWNILKSRNSIETPTQIHLSDWESHFEKLYYNPDPNIMRITQNTNLGNHDYCFSNWNCPGHLNDDISDVEILLEIYHAPNNKACGPDGISYETLKLAFGIIFSHLIDIFQTCFSNGKLPISWKYSYVKPLYKGKGSKTAPGNYRGISLLVCLYKIFTGIIYKRLESWAEKILPPSQYGFRKGKSTIDAITQLKTQIDYNVGLSGKYYACFIDFEKAFDTVDRDLLIEKLICFGLNGRILKTIKSICDTNYQYIIDGGHRSRQIAQSRGVAQGDKLSPLLFSLYIADMNYFLQDLGCDIIFYADDMVIGSSDLSDVQKCLDDLAIYCQNNGIRVNCGKTQAIKFRGGGQISRCDKLFIKGEQIEFVNTFEYLGVILSTKLACTHHLKHLKNCASKASGSLAQKLDLKKVNFQSASTLMESVIYPSGSYGMEIFQDSLDYPQQASQHIDKIYGLFWKKCCGAPKWISNRRLLTELYGQDPLNLREAPFWARRVYATFYSNGLHHKLCHNSCYYRNITCRCLCRHCSFLIADENHIFSCSSFMFLANPIDKIKFVFYQC